MSFRLFPFAFPAPFAQTLRDGLDRLLVRGIQQVGVDHGRGRDRAMPERLADVVDRCARVVGERRESVPQSVQGELGQVVFTDKCAECFGQIVRQIGFAVRPGQHIAGVMIVRAVKQPVLALLPALGAQHADDLVRYMQQAGRGTVFGVLFNHLRPGHRAGAVDAQRFALEIDILPAQTAHFLAAQAEIARQIDDRLQAGALDGIQQPEQGFNIVIMRLRALEFGRLYTVGRVAGKHILHDRDPQRIAQQVVVFARGVRGQAAVVAQIGIILLDALRGQ